MKSIFITSLLLFVLCNGHGRLVTPAPRQPNEATWKKNAPVQGRASNEFVCRHDPESNLKQVDAGSQLKLEWIFDATHVGDCAVYVSYDVTEVSNNAKAKFFKIANIFKCRDFRKNGLNKSYSITLPSWLPKGRAVLRWEWYALHQIQGDNVEFYSQCVDIDIQSDSKLKPADIPSYSIINYNGAPIFPQPSRNNYRDPFTSNTPQYVTGPPCAFDDMTENNCGLTKKGTKGFVDVPTGSSPGNSGNSPVSDPTPKPTSSGPQPTPKPTSVPQPTPKPTAAQPTPRHTLKPSASTNTGNGECVDYDDNELDGGWKNHGCKYVEEKLTKEYCLHATLKEGCCFCGGGRKSTTTTTASPTADKQTTTTASPTAESKPTLKPSAAPQPTPKPTTVTSSTAGPTRKRRKNRSTKAPTAESTPKPTRSRKKDRKNKKGSQSEGSSLQVTGYLENWENVNWWADDMPGKCATGCVKEAEVRPLLKPYTAVNYGFALVSNTLDYKQTSCEACELTKTKTETGNALDICCPMWDGKSLYNAKFKKVNEDKNSGRGEASRIVAVEDMNAGRDPVWDVIDDNGAKRGGGVINMGEFCRIAHEEGKTCLIALGGWSDWGRIGTKQNAEKLAKVVAYMVLWSFADGVDMDLEHIYEFEERFGNEIASFSHLVVKIKEEFKKMGSEWHSAINTRLSWLKSGKVDQSSTYYKNQLAYLQGLLAKDEPTDFIMSYTTRFNGVVPENGTYVTEDSIQPPKEGFATRNEAKKVWDLAGDSIDQVNIMSYDAGSPNGPLTLDFEQILKNFAAGGIPKGKIVIGFEPIQPQAAGGRWEGAEVDLEVAQYVAENCYGGAMFWALNDPKALDNDIVDLANDVEKIMQAARESCKPSTTTKNGGKNKDSKSEKRQQRKEKRKEKKRKKREETRRR